MIRLFVTARFPRFLTLALALLSWTASLGAATKKWDGGAGNVDWVSGLNWNPENVPATGDDIVVDSTFGAIPSSMLFNGGVVNAQSITFAVGFNPTSTTLLGGGGNSPSYLLLGVAGSPSPLIKVNTATGTITFERRNGGTADLYLELGGTASIDVNAGATLNINTEVSGPYGITKAGAGTLRLGGTNVFSGATIVTQGTLALVTAGSSSGSITGSTAITVNSGAMLDVSGVTFTLQGWQTLAGNGTINGNVSAATGSTVLAGPVGTPGTLTLNNSLALNNTTLVFDLADLTTEGAGINDKLDVSGNLTLSGNNVISLNYLNGSLPVGTYRIIRYSGVKSGNFVLSAPYQNVTLDETTTPNYVTLVVTSPGSPVLNLIWEGDGAANVWDMAATANWLNGATASDYFDPADVTIGNSGSASPAINLTTTVVPRSISISSTLDYVIGGAGSIGSIPGLSNALIKGGSGILTLATSNDFAGGVDVQAGMLKVGNASAIPSGAGRGDIALAGTLDLNGHSVAVNGFAGSGIVDNQSGTSDYVLIFGRNDGSGTFPGIIRNTSGSVGLTKIGTGRIILGGNNTFAGPVTISDGALRVLHSNALGNTAGSTLIDGGNTMGRLELMGGITLDENFSLAMKFSIGSGSKDAQIPHIVNVSGNNTLNGAFTLNSGGTFWTFQSDAGKLTINKGLISSTTGGRPILLQGVGEGEIKGPIQNGFGQVALVKSGSGTWTLSGTNTYSQSTTINAGTLKIGSSNAVPNGVGKSDVGLDGTLDLNGHSITINGLSGPGIVDNTSGAATYVLSVGDNNRSGTFSGVIKNTSGTIAVSKVGTNTIALAGANTYTGNTTVSAGTLLLNGSIESPAVAVKPTATLSGYGLISGSVVVEGGGTVAPGTSIGTLFILGSVSLAGNSLMEISRTAGILAGDMVLSADAMTYGGMLTVTATGDALAEGDTFVLFAAASFSGSFAASSLPSLASCLVWDISMLSVDGSIKVVRETVNPTIGDVTATENQPGTVTVKDCAASTVPGTVNISVQASDSCGLAGAPLVGLTNGANGQLAVFVNESPLGTFNYTWTVTSSTASGTWTATATATDSGGNRTTSAFTLCVVQQLTVTGQVELQGFVATSRLVTFVATGGVSNKTWNSTLTFAGAPRVASYSLIDVPPGTTGVSAKTTWNLRRKLAVSFTGGQAVANFTGASVLLGGDIAGANIAAPPNNSINISDYNKFKSLNGRTGAAAVPADITGNGSVNTADFTVLRSNLGRVGEAQ